VKTAGPGPERLPDTSFHLVRLIEIDAEGPGQFAG
jgi:hypothetical protein